MLALLPLLTVGLLVLLLQPRLGAWREAILAAALVGMVVATCLTELLSVFRALTLVGVASGWLLVVVCAVTVGWRDGSLRRRLSIGLQPLVRPAGVEKACAGVLVGLVLVLGVTTLIAPPNTWDSMTYHLPRVMHWIENRTVWPYPTSIPRQLSLAPGAEFAILQLQILSGGDRLAGLVQWSSMLGALVGVSVLARDLGASSEGQLGATVICAAVPIGILESTSTQNDYVVAFWLVCVVVCVLRVASETARHRTLLWAIALGASLGLAVLTKATAYVFALPFVLWSAWLLVRRLRWRAWQPLALVGVLAVVLNLGTYTRNFLVFGSPLGPNDEGDQSLSYTNATLTPPLLLSNLARNVSMQFVATPVFPLNVASVEALRVFHEALGVAIDDPATTWGTQQPRPLAAGLAFDENFASNPLHLGLLLGCLAVAWRQRRRVAGGRRIGYAAALLAGFLLFSAVLRWQPWNSRLLLPLLVLSAPLIGAVIWRASARLGGVLAVAMVVAMLPWVAYNQARPLVGPRSILGVSRDDQYFTNQPSLRTAYFASIGELANRSCAQVGLISGRDGWEYPLWALLQERVPGPVEIRAVGVADVSYDPATSEGVTPAPCGIVSLVPDQRSVDVSGRVFSPGFVSPSITVLTPEVRAQ